MTIDEAIKHCEEKAEQLEGYAEPYRSMGNCEKCAEEHRQLAEWLKELKAYREQSKDAVRRPDVFDMIREEIEQASYEYYFEYGEYIGEDTRKERIINTNKVLQIIDKYKAEGSDKE